MAERVLEHINETIREQEGKERLRQISKDLWVGQGYVVRDVSVCKGADSRLYTVVWTLPRRRGTWARGSC